VITSTGTAPETAFIQASLQNMLILINTLKVSIQKYLPALDVALSLRGSIATPLKVPAIIMVRLLWKDRYPGAKADRFNYFYRSAIRDIYYELGRGYEWANDPLSLILP
jgi:hypothetical protein